VEIALMIGDANNSSPATWEMKKTRVSSEWKDAGHAGWFRSMFDEFAGAIDARDYVSRETEASVRCVDLITTAYASALDGSRERDLMGEV